MMFDWSDSSSSSEEENRFSDFDFSEDDLELLNPPLNKRTKNENYFENTIPQYSEEEFVEHFRLERETAEEIANQFKASKYYNYQAGGNGKLNETQHVFIFLWFAGHQTASFRDVADRFDVTISTLYVVIQRMVYFLSNLSADVIQWPSATEKADIERHFSVGGFPGVIGAIDGTHIKIDKPKNDPDSYYNRRHYYSIQMQAVCDHKRKIRDIFVGYPGSVHDSRVFRTSPLAETLGDKCGNDYILGDSGYPCLPHLLIPYKDRGQLDEFQLNFNVKLSTNRYVVEHCFGLLKQRFRQLYHLKFKSIKLIVHFIRACCVLHNFAIENDVIVLPNAEHAGDAEQMPDNVEDDEDEVDNASGIERRNYVAYHVLNR